MMQVCDYIDKLKELGKDSKYLKWYTSIVISSLDRNIYGTYTEKHHILPKSLGGDNNKENIVSLTAREHFICHKLLYRVMLSKVNRKKMLFAFHMMSKCNNQNQKRTINSREYNKIRSELSLMSSGENNHFYGKTHNEESRKKIGEKSKGRIPGKITRQKMSMSRLGKKKDPDVVRRQVETRIANGNNRHSEETKKKMSEARLGRKTGRPAWNRGLTKETNSSVAAMAEKKLGTIPWNKKEKYD